MKRAEKTSALLIACSLGLARASEHPESARCLYNAVLSEAQTRLRCIHTHARARAFSEVRTYTKRAHVSRPGREQHGTHARQARPLAQQGMWLARQRQRCWDARARSGRGQCLPDQPEPPLPSLWTRCQEKESTVHRPLRVGSRAMRSVLGFLAGPSGTRTDTPLCHRPRLRAVMEDRQQRAGRSCPKAWVHRRPIQERSVPEHVGSNVLPLPTRSLSSISRDKKRWASNRHVPCSLRCGRFSENAVPRSTI